MSLSDLPPPPIATLVAAIFSNAVTPHDDVRVIAPGRDDARPQVFVNGTENPEVTKHFLAYINTHYKAGPMNLNPQQVDRLVEALCNRAINLGIDGRPHYDHSGALWVDNIRDFKRQQAEALLSQDTAPPTYNPANSKADSSLMRALFGADTAPTTPIAIVPSDDRVAPPGVIKYGAEREPTILTEHAPKAVAAELGIDPIDAQHLLDSLALRAQHGLISISQKVGGAEAGPYTLTANDWTRAVEHLSRSQVRELVKRDVERLGMPHFTAIEQKTGISWRRDGEAPGDAGPTTTDQGAPTSRSLLSRAASPSGHTGGIDHSRTPGSGGRGTPG